MTENLKNWNDFATVYNNVAKYPRLSDVAHKLDLSIKTVKNKAPLLRRLRETDVSYPVLIFRHAKADTMKEVGAEHRTIETIIDSADLPIEKLLVQVFEASKMFTKSHDQKKCVDIKLQIPGPYGVVGIPDHHLNNIGTMVERAFKDADTIAQHPALFAVGIGDWLDNFIVGFLERERRKDKISHSDAWRLLEHYLHILAPKLIAGISGNHMDWTTSAGGVDVMKKIFEDLGLGAIYDTDEIRVRLISPNGASSTHLARHKYRGNSRFNSVHAITVYILERWQGEDVVWGGHIHVAGHTSIEKQWMGQSRVVHGVQLASYKAVDGYAVREGFRPNTPFLVPMTIHIPETGETLFFEDMYRGIQVLDMLRKDAGF